MKIDDHTKDSVCMATVINDVCQFNDDKKCKITCYFIHIGILRCIHM